MTRCLIYYRVLNHPSLKAVKQTSIRVRCAHITWQVLEETRLFFDQRLGPNDFMNKILGLIEYVRRNKLLYLVTMPRKCNNQNTGNHWATHEGKGKGDNMQEHGFPPSDFPMPKGPNPY